MKKIFILGLTLLTLSACGKNKEVVCINESSTVSLSSDKSGNVQKVSIVETTEEVSVEEFEQSKEMLQTIFDEMMKTEGVNTHFEHIDGLVKITLELDLTKLAKEDLSDFVNGEATDGKITQASMIETYEKQGFTCN